MASMDTPSPDLSPNYIVVHEFPVLHCGLASERPTQHGDCSSRQHIPILIFLLRRRDTNYRTAG